MSTLQVNSILFQPSNIFVSEDLQQVQVGDFGLACSILSYSTHVPLSVASSHHHGDQIGTKLYAAPEQLKGACTFKVCPFFNISMHA